MLIQATTIGRRYHKGALKRMTGIDMKTARIFKSRNDGVSPFLDVEEAVGSMLVALEMAIVIDEITQEPKKLTRTQEVKINKTAVGEIETGGHRFHGRARRIQATLVESAKNQGKEKEGK